jgi:hypothetical protein
MGISSLGHAVEFVSSATARSCCANRQRCTGFTMLYHRRLPATALPTAVEILLLW